jgi:hypothetical protein
MMVRIVGWLINFGELLVIIDLLMLLLAAFVKRSRGAAGGLLLFSAIAWALTLTVWSAVTVYSGWGGFLTVVGLLLGIVGIIPVAFVCLLFNAHWFDLLELLFQAALVAGGFYLSTRLARSHLGD